MKIAKLCINTWAYASRDKRELAACQELGAEVEVFAKGGSVYHHFLLSTTNL